jgi:hypothetical protein
MRACVLLTRAKIKSNTLVYCGRGGVGHSADDSDGWGYGQSDEAEVMLAYVQPNVYAAKHTLAKIKGSPTERCCGPASLCPHT